MKLNRGYLLIELFFLFIYFFLVLFSIILQPVNLILGFFFVFILPGYNLISILKPEYQFSEKLGYMIVLSLALESTLMLFNYTVFYNFESFPESNTRGFIFNPIILISTILSINLILILIKIRKNYKIKQNNDFKQKKKIINLKSIKRRINPKNLIIITSLFISLILLCVSTIFSDVPNNEYLNNYVEYRTNFTFFLRVPLIFYFFLIISILCLTYIIFSVKNSYIILTCISIFLYCLWILPYLQIGNYFNHDSFLLLTQYETYLDYGLISAGRFNLIVYDFDALRYSTGLFSAILLTSATSMEINFVLWYLFPLFYIFLPFFFYSVLKKYSKEKHNNEIIQIIFVIFMLFTPLILKYGHSISTGVFGLIVFLILIVEFYNLMQENNFNLKNSFLIVLLYFFLSLTHTEECIYFLVLFFLYSIYYFFFEIQKIKGDHSSHSINENNSLKEGLLILGQAIDRKMKEDRLKKRFIKIVLLLIILSLIFYLTLIFFGYFNFYFKRFLGFFDFLNSFYNQIINTQIKIPLIFRGNLSISLFFIIFIFLGIILIYIILYLCFFEKYHIISRIFNFSLKIFKKIYYAAKIMISKKSFHIILLSSLFIIFLIIDFKILGSVEKRNLVLTIITLTLSYSTMLFQIFLFLKGILFYQIENDKQNFYLLVIISSSISIGILLISNLWLTLYILHTRFFVILVFCNSIIIIESYSKEYINRNNIYLKFLTIIILFLGVFYSLRTLSYG